MNQNEDIQHLLTEWEAEILVDPTLNMRLTNGLSVLEEKVWVNDVIKSEVSGLYSVQAFAHYRISRRQFS
ncbi:hypothetical protein KAI37_03817 [Paenibacillus sp. S25]|nr:hypothetical protein BK135_17210 [Paenibacillus peoriae]QYK63484.1 hypothetical protein KAI37_03817 [Paenibacillus sp. S25]